MNVDEIEDYYKKYGPMVLRRCRSMLVNEERALDAMQEVFIKLLTNQKTLSSAYPSALLYKIATNVCLNIIKSEKKREPAGADDILSAIACHDSFEERIIISSILEKIFSKEPVSTREIAVMHYIDGMTLEQTAAESGLSVSGVRKRLRKLKEKNLHLQD
jgi:RNA polymerase sigma-70 factor (ECF subfamily)